MSLFASGPLAAGLTTAEGMTTRLSSVACEGHVIPVIFAGARPILDRVWLDFLEPSDGLQHEPETFVRYVPRLVVGKVSAEQWHAEVEPTAARRRLQAAPAIDLARFDRWDDVEAWIRTKRSGMVKNVARLARKAERELGPLTFNAADPDEAAFEQLLCWKRAHYRRTGVGDPLAVPANIELMRALFRDGTLEHSSLRAGDRLMAGIALVRQAGRVYYWLPSYDTELAAWAPGNQVLLRSIRHAYDSGEREYDFMIGDEAYKWYFATDARLVGPVGTTPVARRARRVAGAARRRLLAGAGFGGSGER